jgi:pimeloyl-ACP methyl ester carboxylesterase
MDYLIRTRLAKDIVCEVAMPERQTGRVAVVCGGAPSLPPGEKVLRFLAAEGYVALGMRYRGTWESEGSFLEKSPSADVADIITELTRTKKIKDLSTGEDIALKIKHLDLFGGSFGGPAVLLNSRNKHVRKVVALAPVIDFGKCGPGETFSDYVQFSREAFGGAYRVQKKSDWQKLLRPDFYNPITMTGEIAAKKCFVIQALDDDVCLSSNTRALQEILPEVTIYYKPKGGHMGTRKILHRFYWKKIAAFLK